MGIRTFVISTLVVVCLFTLHIRISAGDAFDPPLSSWEKYDISTYAPGTTHDERVYRLLETMPQMTSSDDVEEYIRGKFPQSPLTGKMVTRYAKKHKVNVHLILALMRQDSGLGTTGKGARTFNPGNVGTWGGKVRCCDSWDQGVEAVAKWLKKHRKKRADATRRP